MVSGNALAAGTMRKTGSQVAFLNRNVRGDSELRFSKMDEH